MNEQETVARYRWLARAIAADFFLPGADPDDVEQEALVALLLAARSWRPERGASFPAFARLVIRRRLATAVKLALAGRHRPLNESLRAVVLDGETIESTALVVDPVGDPADVAEARERLASVLRAVEDLSPLERGALVSFLNGGSYVGDKRADNAIQRARTKLRAAA